MNTANNYSLAYAAPVVLLLDLILYGVEQGGRAILRHLRAQELKRLNCKPTPSLRGVPQPREITKPWTLIPRTLADRLRIGSRLADLEPTIDNSFVFGTDSHGRRSILCRRPGIKGWLDLHCPTVGYSSAMKYRVLATRIRLVCGVDATIPLEWLLPDSTEDHSQRTPEIRAAIQKGRRTLATLLRDFSNLDRLKTEVESRLKIVRIPSKRQAISLRAKVQKYAAKNGTNAGGRIPKSGVGGTNAATKGTHAAGKRGDSTAQSSRARTGGTNAAAKGTNAARGTAKTPEAALEAHEAVWLKKVLENTQLAASFAMDTMKKLRGLKHPTPHQRNLLAQWDRFQTRPR